TTAGGGYELALACDEIYLIDDGSSAVSLPEVPLLGVLPGTGGLTRLVDKRGVRRDPAAGFATTAEGLKGQRAVDWGLVDTIFPRSASAADVRQRALARAGPDSAVRGPGVRLEPLQPEETDSRIHYRYVTLELHTDERTADLTVHGPSGDAVEWAL